MTALKGQRATGGEQNCLEANEIVDFKILESEAGMQSPLKTLTPDFHPKVLKDLTPFSVIISVIVYFGVMTLFLKPWFRWVK